MHECFFSWMIDAAWPFLKPILQSLISGGFLVLLGYALFKRQERFKSSTKEVQRICNQVSLYLFAYRELRFEYEALQRVSCGRRSLGDNEFPTAFFDAPKNRKRIFCQILAARKLKNVDQVFPDPLKNYSILFKPLGWIHSAGTKVLVDFDIMLKVMEGILNDDPAIDVDQMKRSWLMYQTATRQLNMVLDFLAKICDDSVWVLLDRAAFEAELGKFNMIDQELNRLQDESLDTDD